VIECFCNVLQYDMDENDTDGLTVVNNIDTDKCPHVLAMPENTEVPSDVEAHDIKPELIDLSENTPCEVRPGHQQACHTKACQTEITICDEFWNVCISQCSDCSFSSLVCFC